jgi:hypothetical protein
MFATEFENTLNTTVITAFDESEGKCLFGICSNLSLIKDLSLFKDNRHIDTRALLNFGSSSVIIPLVAIADL